MKRAKLQISLGVFASLALGGCSYVHQSSQQHVPIGGATAYWNRTRLLDATAFAPAGVRKVLGEPRIARATPRALRVGALFVRSGSSNHFCTASVVASPKRDLLITAAHCIHGGKGGSYRTDIVFVPGYRDGAAPYGIWNVARLFVSPEWIKRSDPSLDVGFVVLRPHHGKNVEDVLGANQLGVDTQYRYRVRVTGYPSSADAPITCINWTTSQSATQLRFDCPDYTGGTSGSPWVTHFNTRTRTGTIVGVIGGYQLGGESASISYSSYFGPAVKRLYQAAVAKS